MTHLSLFSLELKLVSLAVITFPSKIIGIYINSLWSLELVKLNDISHHLREKHLCSLRDYFQFNFFIKDDFLTPCLLKRL